MKLSMTYASVTILWSSEALMTRIEPNIMLKPKTMASGRIIPTIPHPSRKLREGIFWGD